MVRIMRGPVLILGVFISMFLPYLASFSNQFLLHLAIAAVGLSFCVLDFYTFTEALMRRKLSNFMDSITLDDVLRAIFDPETGIVACLVGSFVGMSTMYALPLDDEQRTELVEATFWIPKREAKSVLLDAGGFKALLPGPIQSWLDRGEVFEMNKTSHVDNAVTIETVDAESDSSISDCQSSEHEYTNCSAIEPPFSEYHEPAMKETEQKSDATRDPLPRPTQPFPKDPVVVMFAIVRKIVLNRIRPYFASIPESSLEMIGTAAAVALCAQMGLRFRSKKTFWSSAGTLLLSGLSTGAFATLLVRHTVMGTIRDMDSLKVVSEATLLRVLERFKRLAAKNHRWKGFLAILVLFWAGRQRHRTVSNGRSRVPVDPR